MFDTASAWLMTSLYADPVAVSLVQTATSLPMFLLTLPAGALADIIDSRRLLIVVTLAVATASAIFAALVSLGLAASGSVLFIAFLLGVAGALSGPAWISITPLLVPQRDLAGAVAAGSAGFNLSRAVGPALGGAAIAGIGISSPFWIFSVCNIGIVAALLWWRSPRKSAPTRPRERIASAIGAGLRHAAHSRPLRATLIRTLAFFPFASAV
jgi:MFS family permease